MSDLNTEIKIGADASGVEAGVRVAKRSLKDLGDSAKRVGKDAGDGMGSIGDGSDKAAKKVESATRSMQNSLQRLLAEQKAGVKGSREYWEALADAKGVGRGSIKGILDQIDTAKAKTLAAKNAAESWTTSLGKVGPMVAAAFSGAAVVGFLGKVVAVQREFDVLNSSLKTVTGSSAAAEREMGWLKNFAKETPFGLAQATQGFVKMKALGLDPTRAALTSFGNTASAMGKGLNQMIEAVADASTGEFERLKEFGIKAKKEGDQVSLTFQGVTTTIGNSATEITKYLEKIGNTSFGGAMEERAKTLDGTIAALGDTWDELFRTVSTNNVGGLIFDSVTLANGALEDATTILRALGGAAQDAGRDTGALSTIQSGIATVFETVAVLGANLKFVLVGIGNEIGGLAAQVAQAAQFNFSGVAAIRRAMVADAEAARKEIDATTARILNARKEQELYASYATRNASAATDPRRLDLGAPAKSTGSTGASKDAIKAANKELEDQAKLVAELSGLTGSFADDWERLTAIYKKGQLSLEGLTQAQATLLSKQPAIKAATEEQAKAEKLRTDAASALLAAEAARVSSIEKSTVGMAEQNRSLTDEIELLGLSEQAQHAITQARLSSIIAIKEERVARLQNSEFISREQIALEEEIRLLKERSSLQGQKFAKTESEKAADEQLKIQSEMWKSVDDVAHDTFVSIFDSGKSAFDRLKDTLKNGLYSLLYQMTVKKWLINVVASSSGAGVAQQAFGAQGGSGGGLMGMASNANSLNSLWGAGSQALYGGAAGASTASLGYANAVGAVGGDGLGALIGANAQWAGVATGSAAAAKAAIAANLAMPAGTAVALPAGTLAASGTGAAAAGPLAAMGPVGWAALAAVAAYAIFGGKGGGPKTESGGGYGIGGYMNSGGPAVDYAKGVEATYAGLAKQLGLTGSLSVGAFTSQDKAGDSMTQVEVLAALNGQSIYGRGARLGGVENVGRSDEELQAALAEEATRVLFGALKASDLPEQYKAYLNTVADGAAAMQAAIEKVVGVKQFADALNKLPFDNLKNLAFDASDSLLTLSGGLESMLGSLKSYYELYYTDAERLAQSQATMTDALAKLGLALPQTKDGFRELVNGMDLTTESSRIAYMALLQLAPEFAATADGLSALAKTAAADLFKSFFDSAKINFAGLGDALASVDYSTFTETVALVFDNLAGRIKGVMDGIANERNAVADARLKILDPGVMSKDAILRGIADASISAPTNAALVAAQTSLGGVDADVAAKAASVARAKAIKPDTSALDSARTTFTNAQAVTGNASAWVDYMRAAEGGKFNWWVDEAMAGRQHDAGPSDSGENNAYRIVATYKAALEAQTAPQAAYEQALSAYSAALAVNAGKVAEAQAILTAATADQSAAVLVARQAQLDYIASLQDFAIDAGKSVTKLGKLREETLKYYEAQKQLADLMTNSAAGLRESVRVTRMGQLDSAQSLAQRQAEFQTNYSMALVTSGATQAGYADKLAAALPDLSVALMDTAGTREEWARATAALLAQSEAIAGKLEANTPTDYVAESLAMLTSIDTTLAALQESATSAEKIIADAVAAGSEKTAAGLRAVIAALTGQSVPAFAAGGYHGGGLRIVGENGPEIEASGPSRIWNANQTAAMLGGGGMAQELRALREEVRGLRAEAQATAGHTNKTARLLERAMPDGDALAVREAAV